jgi:L-ribulokinase
MSAPRYSLGLDFGTHSVRALLAEVSSGEELGVGSSSYARGESGVIVDPRDPHFARQHPLDWEAAAEAAVRQALDAANRAAGGLRSEAVVGVGIDATASTPLLVDARCRPLAADPSASARPQALAWLWKDHTAHAEAAEISARAHTELPAHLSRCGGAYSSEWFFAKLLRCLREAPDLVAAAAAWVECGDWIAGALTGCDDPRRLPRNVCAAGHKGFYHEELGYPPRRFLDALDPRLGAWCEGKLGPRPRPAGERAGALARSWAERLGLREGTPVSVAAIDAHVGAVGAGVRPGVLVKILGTSACDLLVHPADAEPIGEIPGLCGVVRDSILPGHWGLEAGQAAFGDLFGWFVREFGEPAGLGHGELSRRAAALAPGESGLLALDWNNGNRSVLADPLLTGLLVGQTLRTTPAEVYRALLEGAAFGARMIVERIAEHGVAVDSIVACGGVAERNDLLLGILADVLGRPLRLSRAKETCALGAAIFGAVAGGAHPDVETAQSAMSGLKEVEYRPDRERAAVYSEIFALYRDLHDEFSGVRRGLDLSRVMKELLRVRTTRVFATQSPA